MREALYLTIDVFSIFVSLLLMVAGVVTAVRCGQKKLSPVAGWILTAGLAIGFVCDIGFAVSGHVLAKALGISAYQVIALFFSLVNLAGMVAVAAGIAMFSAKPAAQQVRHG